MTSAFHVDRAGTLSPGTEILVMRPPIPVRPGGTPDWQAMAFLDAAFPDGMSRFGCDYLLARPFLTGTEDTGQETDLIFELVRRLSFPDRPSRYASIFASATLDEARRFRTDFCGGNGRIWEVAADTDVFRGDHELLDLSDTPLDVWMRAERYWRGESSASPAWELLLTPPVRVIAEA